LDKQYVDGLKFAQTILRKFVNTFFVKNGYEYITTPICIYGSVIPILYNYHQIYGNSEVMTKSYREINKSIKNFAANSRVLICFADPKLYNKVKENIEERCKVKFSRITAISTRLDVNMPFHFVEMAACEFNSLEETVRHTVAPEHTKMYYRVDEDKLYYTPRQIRLTHDKLLYNKYAVLNTPDELHWPLGYWKCLGYKDSP
jgi:hypothetical protein